MNERFFAGPQWIMPDDLLLSLAQQPPQSSKEVAQRAARLLRPASDMHEALPLLRQQGSKVCVTGPQGSPGAAPVTALIAAA